MTARPTALACHIQEFLLSFYKNEMHTPKYILWEDLTTPKFRTCTICFFLALILRECV